MKNPSLILLGAALAASTLSAGCTLKKQHHDDPSATFTFASDPASDYPRVDRVGMPAVATAVITNKDAYNDSNPSDDAMGVWVPQITANIGALHGALDDDLGGAGLVPATSNESLGQAAPLIVPDTLKIDTAAAAGFPNGRRLSDPVVDVTLAVVLLKLGTGGQNALTLANLPLNPPANDKTFNASFPYLAAPF